MIFVNTTKIIGTANKKINELNVGDLFIRLTYDADTYNKLFIKTGSTACLEVGETNKWYYPTLEEYLIPVDLKIYCS